MHQRLLSSEIKVYANKNPLLLGVHMKLINKFGFILSLAILSIGDAFALRPPVPEMDSGVAVLGLGLLVGLLSLASEYRRKK